MPFIPLGDSNPRILLRYPWVTWGLILSCVLIFAWQASTGIQVSAYRYGFIPAVFTGERQLPPELVELPAFLTLLTYNFLHGSTAHLVGNMLALWVFGDNVEDAMGHVRFLAFYLLCGVAAGLVHFLAYPSSEVPMIGASGAIFGLLGAYLILHPKARILSILVVIPLRLPAYVLIAAWFAFQFYAVFTGGDDFGNVAWWAHIGGFFAGLLLVFAFKRNTVVLFGGDPPPQGIVQRKTFGARNSRDRNAKRKRESPMPNAGETHRRPKGPWERSR